MAQIKQVSLKEVLSTWYECFAQCRQFYGVLSLLDRCLFFDVFDII